MKKCDYILAEMQTDHYTFRAIAVDDESARRAILRGWLKHFEQLGYEPTMGSLKELDDWYGINTYPVILNDCLRDDDVLGVH